MSNDNLSPSLVEQLDKDLVLLDTNWMLCEINELYERLNNICDTNCYEGFEIIIKDEFQSLGYDYAYDFLMTSHDIFLKVYNHNMDKKNNNECEVIIEFNKSDFKDSCFDFPTIPWHRRLLNNACKKIYNELPGKIKTIKFLF